MECRLAAKLEKASNASKEAAHQAKLNSESLEQLESRVDANEQCLLEDLRESEARLMAQVQNQVETIMQDKIKELFTGQLEAAGFDTELSAADLTVRNSVNLADKNTTSSYARAAATPAASASRISSVMECESKKSRQEMKFWHARRSLRLWPIGGGKKEELHKYLKEKLRLDQEFIEEELGEVVLVKPREPKNRNKDEYVVTFESKQVRDAVKAAAANLANHRDKAGMRLHVPDHLQKEFHSLMNLSYDLKKRHPKLKRNVKFDKEDFGLFMDVRMSEEGDWKRVKPAQAMAAVKKNRKDKVQGMGEDELRELLSEGESE